MITILHASDLHFGPPYVTRVGEALRAAARVVDPDIIVASGDFTQRAKEQQFAEARAYLDSLPAVPILVVPGNHDVPLYRVLERIFDPYRWYRRHISEQLDYVYRMDGAVFVMLNSTSPLRAITNGRIDSSQLAFARERSRARPDEDLKVVVAHHHFAPAPDYEGGEVMPRAMRAIDAFTELEVDLILGGHLHRAYIGNSLDLYPGADRVHGITIVQSGTSTSRRGRAPGTGEELLQRDPGNGGGGPGHALHVFRRCRGFASVSRHIFPRSPVSFFRDTRDAGPHGRWA
jgi:3',5'-cyclic AMP phosphodiesterase CpdA